MPGLGIAKTMSFDSGVFTQVNWTSDDPGLLGYASLNASQPPAKTALWLDAQGPDVQEAKLEAGAHPVTLSTGDYLHFFSGPTTQNKGRGNYTAGWMILDKDDPTKVLQRSPNFFWPEYDYEIDNPPYQGERAWVIFLCSAIPTGKKDEFRLFWGGGDGNVGTGLVQVTMTPQNRRMRQVASSK